MGIYERIRDLCNSRGMAISTLEKKVGLSNATISKWKGKNGARAESVRKIADYFGVTEKYLMTGETDEDGYYLPSVVEEACNAAVQELHGRIGDFYADHDLTLHLIYSDGWYVRGDEELIAAVQGLG